MNVRRPEWDEQPLSPMLWNARLNQSTILSGVIGPPRSDRMTGPMPFARPCKGGERLAKIGMQRDQSAAAVLGGDVMQLDHRTDIAGWIKHHVPGQMGDLTGPQTSLGGQQHDQTIARSDGVCNQRRLGGLRRRQWRVFLLACRTYFATDRSHYFCSKITVKSQRQQSKNRCPEY